MKNGLFSRVLVVLGVAVAMSGCSDSYTSSSSVDTDTYLFYAPTESSVPAKYGLKAVDPAYPSTPIAALGAATPTSPFKPISYLSGNVNTGSHTISDLHYRYVMYTEGTSLYRVSAEKADGLAIAQVSNESQIVGSTTGPVPGICYTDPSSSTTFSWGYTDYADPLNSVFIYRKDPDGSDDCSVTPGNDALYIVQLKDDSSTPPGTYPITLVEEPVAPVYNSDGSINSILMWAASSPGKLAWVNVDFNNGAWVTTTGYSSKPSVLGIDSQGRILLAVYGPWGINIQQFDPVSRTLSATLHNSAAGTIPKFYVSDGTYAYFHDNQKVYRVPFDGSANATVVADESANFTGGLIRAGWTGWFTSTRVQDIQLSGNNLVYIYDDSSGAVPAGTSNQAYVRSVPKSGGTPKTIYTFPNNSELLAWRAAAGRVYLSRYDVKEAISVGDTGSSPEVYDQSWWLGFTFNSSARLFSDFTQVYGTQGRDLVPRTIFRAQFGPSGELPAKLISYDADTTAQLIDFGIPAPTFGSFNLGGPPDTLGLTTSDRTLMAYDGTGGAPGTDILYLHARNKSSMTVAERDNPDLAVLIGVNNGGGCSFGNGRFDPLLPVLMLLSAVYLWRRRRARRQS